jgi:hypothetical protein
MDEPGWWPTKGQPPRSEYAQAATCEGCHRKIAPMQKTTPMYHAGMRADQSEMLKEHPVLTFQEGPFSTSLVTAASGVTLTVTDGVNTASASPGWAFGVKNGQTYILQKDGAYFESRLSYFTKVNGLDITPGHSPEVPDDVGKALGRKMEAGEAQRCFSCHTTAAVTSNVFESEKAVPGVGCEACHGPGAAHSVAMAAQKFEAGTAAIFNPANLSPSDSVDFCGACHRTWADVAMNMPANLGAVKIRFQPYRVELSRCWGENGDSRITCIACHDPHQPLVRESTAYDSKCLACHAVRQGTKVQMTARTFCKVATSNCVSCHMPKAELPQTHAMFTDHDIRIVR